MPPFRVRSTTDQPQAPSMRAPTLLERLYDLYQGLPNFPPAEIARTLAPKDDLMPLTSVLPAGEAAEFAEQQLAGPVKRTIKAYHGSPHDFDQFSLSKIGTGEGAQAYGHGLYFAENPSVANEYRVALAQKAMRQQKAQNAKDVAASLLEKGDIKLGNRPYVASRPGEAMNLAQDIEEGIVTADLLPDWAQKKLGITNPARTYEVNIHASPDELLDWDKPLSQQPPKVQEALAKLDPDTYHPSGSDYDPMESGQQTYHRLEAPTKWPSGAPRFRSSSNVADRVGATEKLKELGIKGIQYLDQGSRSAGEGTKNFVIWDDKIIEISRKFGVSLPVAASLYKWQQSQKSQKGVE